MLLRRDQLGLHRIKKDANKEVKAPGKDAAKVAGKRSSGAPGPKAKKAKAGGSKDWVAADDDEWWAWDGAWENEHWQANDWWVHDGGEEQGWDWEQGSSGELVAVSKTGKNGASQAKKGKGGNGRNEKTPAPKKAKAEPNPKPKAKAKAKGAAKATPKADAKKKAKAKQTAKKSDTDPQESDIDRLLAWVDEVDMEADPETFKLELQGKIPTLDQSIRLNKYWNRPGCGVTLRYVDENNERKQRDVAYFTLGKGIPATLFVMISGLYMATQIDRTDVIYPLHHAIKPLCEWVLQQIGILL